MHVWYTTAQCELFLTVPYRNIPTYLLTYLVTFCNISQLTVMNQIEISCFLVLGPR